MKFRHGGLSGRLMPREKLKENEAPLAAGGIAAMLASGSRTPAPTPPPPLAPEPQSDDARPRLRVR